MRLPTRTSFRRLVGLSAATMALAGGTTMASGGTANAAPGDNVCRYASVNVATFNILPCVYQDSSGYVHGKAIATGGSTEAYLHVQIGYRCDGGSVNWVPGTDTSLRIGAGGGTLYTVPTDGIGTLNGCQYFSKTWIFDNDTAYGDVEAGPIYT
ncbi:hypothetical protein ACFZB9_22015 [Kitasatospora sp. NPDC008050]|uniref:hypothetical protein n=1 Tax=Kitasatospora sp. NPDC008050 TaxID=3364021 RepID=UPI0036ED45D9